MPEVGRHGYAAHMDFPAGYGTTLLVELPLLLLAAWALGWLRRVGWPRVLLAGLVANLTHPVLWWLTAGEQLSTVLVAEVAAVVIEAAVLVTLMRRWGAVRATWGSGMLIALFTNCLSFLSGLTLVASTR